VVEHVRAEPSIGPGFNPFPAACQTILGECPLAARLMQAGRGMLKVWLMYQSSREFVFALVEYSSRRGCWPRSGVVHFLSQGLIILVARLGLESLRGRRSGGCGWGDGWRRS
jgi:hypothetical protein